MRAGGGGGEGEGEGSHKVANSNSCSGKMRLLVTLSKSTLSIGKGKEMHFVLDKRKSCVSPSMGGGLAHQTTYLALLHASIVLVEQWYSHGSFTEHEEVTSSSSMALN